MQAFSFYYLACMKRVQLYFVFYYASYQAISLIFGGDEESRTPVRKCRPMNLSERRPC